MSLTQIEQSLVLAAFFRGGSQDDRVWFSNTDQVLTLSLYYTSDISAADCVGRFANQRHVGSLYQKDDGVTEEQHIGKLVEEIEVRYRILIDLLRNHLELIEGGGDFETPADPTFTSCRLTDAGIAAAKTFATQFPKKPDFPSWPDKRTMSDTV